MRAILLAGLALALSACGGGGDPADNGANALGADNLLMDENMMMDANAMNGMGGMDANMSTNGATENLMIQDATTNDADTNLANGL